MTDLPTSWYYRRIPADWPIYVNDEGVVSCYACPEDVWTAAAIGRRTTLAAFLDDLEEHIRGDHQDIS